VGQRAKEAVDGEREGLLGILVGEHEPAAADDDLLAWRQEIHVVGLDLEPVLGALHRHGRVPRQELGHQALVVGREVLHDHERHAEVARHAREQLLERLQAPGGGPHAHDSNGIQVLGHRSDEAPCVRMKMRWTSARGDERW
jgi:hypothetical protein